MTAKLDGTKGNIILRRTLTGSRTMSKGTNGSGQRKCTSWIESFVEQTAGLESPEIFRKWTAISAIASAMEQKTWMTTWSPIYPNLYVFLVGRPGVGKSRTIGQGRKLLEELPDLHVAPTSMTMAS